MKGARLKMSTIHQLLKDKFVLNYHSDPRPPRKMGEDLWTRLGGRALCRECRDKMGAGSPDERIMNVV